MKENRITTLSTYNSAKIDTTLSLVDYKNNLFNSSSLQDLFRFYYSFPSRTALLNWLRERPCGNTTSYEYEGDKDFIVVIPTSDIQSDLAIFCRETIFKGLHIIFVESARPKDPYFNYAHSCNEGFKLALKYNPKWIILSNDDIKSSESVDKLKSELVKLKDDVLVAFTEDTSYLSHTFEIRKLNKLGKGLTKISSVLTKYFKSETIKQYALYYKFQIDFSPFYSPPKKISKGNIFYRKIITALVPGPFSAYRPSFIQEMSGKLFDEIFLNGFEDTWLALTLFEKGVKIGLIDYKIIPLGGMSLGKGRMRYLREIPSLVLYNSYVKK